MTTAGAALASKDPKRSGALADMPLVSIVTISRNQSQFLRPCLESVLAQTYPNIEYLVLDAGSTDGSREIIESYADRLAFWRSMPDAGPASSLNEGFLRANGEIFACLNSDDRLRPDAVANWVRAFARNPAAGLAYGDIEFIDADGRVSRPPARHVAVFRAGRWSLRDLACGALILPQQGVAWRRGVHESLGGFNPDNRTCWDGEFFARAAMADFKFCQIREVLAGFRIHATSISGSRSLEAEFETDQRRIEAEWRAKGLHVSRPEQFIRCWGGRFERFLRQPTALLSPLFEGRQRS